MNLGLIMYALIDCNNFFVSCERVFHPELRRCPMVVLSNNGGCVVARSNDVKSYIPMGAVYSQYTKQAKANKVLALRANFPLYADISQRVMRILRKLDKGTEIYSIDEAFVPLPDNLTNQQYREFAEDCKQRIADQVQMPISIGIAPSKALSKVANRIAKKFPEQTNGISVIDTKAKRIKALQWLLVGDVWGIGRQTAQKLNAMNIISAYDFANLPPAVVKHKFSSTVLALLNDLNGLDRVKLADRDYQQSIANTRSFSKPLDSLPKVKERISTFATMCAKKLREQNLVCQEVTVFIATRGQSSSLSGNVNYDRSYTLSLPQMTNSDLTISNYALRALNYIFCAGVGYRRAGVRVTKTAPDMQVQESLFANETKEHRALMTALDNINHRFGAKRISLAVQNHNIQWGNQNYPLSKAYTIHWDQLFQVS